MFRNITRILSLRLYPSIEKVFFNVGGYFVGTIVTAVASVFSVPILIRTLNVEQFGRWSLLEPLIFVLSQIMLLGVNYGIIKLIAQDKHPPFPTFKALLKVSVPMLVSTSVTVVLALLLLRFSRLDSLCFALLVIAEATALLLLSMFRAANAVCAYSVTSATKALFFLAALLMALFSPWLRIDNVRDVVLWRCMAVFAAIALGAYHIWLRRDMALCMVSPYGIKPLTLYKEAVKYGAPMLVTGLLVMVIEFADRYILKAYFDYVTLAHYVVYLKVASFLNHLIIIPFGIWWPVERFHRLNDPDGGSMFFRRTALVILTFFLTAGGVLWLLGPWLFSWFAPAVPFEPTIVLVLIGSVIFMGMGAPLNIGLLSAGKTHLNIYAVLCGALVHVLMCLLFIPKYGIRGAAIATALSYLSYTMILGGLSQFVYPVPFAFTSMCLLFIVGLSELILANVIIRTNGFAAGISKALIFTIVFLLSAFVLSSKDRLVYRFRKIAVLMG